MPNAIFAAAAYFAATFAVGFALGAVRTMVVEPQLGALNAVAIELPVMLLSAWLLCGWSLRQFKVDRAWLHRAAMGFAAFTLLMAAEIALSIFGFGRTLADIFAHWQSPPGALGLAGQVVFALFPLVRHRT